MKTVDPYDVEALEKAINESAVRVSTIWVTYLLFGLYLITAVGNVTSRQLLTGAPFKLPVLNIDLPLIGFFFLAPSLFMVLHAYVLLQLVLLARTAFVYGEAVEFQLPIPAHQERVRQRLANTLFAQMFAGSRREREGHLGLIINIIAWLTLVFCPVALLVFFEIKFLPFHSHLVTWWHRLLIAIDLFVLLLLWNSALTPHREVGSVNFGKAVASLAFAAVVVLIPTFPGEPHASWTRFTATEPTLPHNMCNSKSIFAAILPNDFDRLTLDGEALIDPGRLETIKSRDHGHYAFASERTIDLSGRNFNCDSFRGADLQRADLSDAALVGTRLDHANLQGVELDHANLQNVNLTEAKLQEADLSHAQFQGANLNGAELNEAWLTGAQFQGATLRAVQFNGAVVEGTQFQGAFLQSASFQGVALYRADLQGANLAGARLQAALFKNDQLQAAVLDNAGLQGAVFQSSDVRASSFWRSRLQGAVFSKDTKLSLSNFSQSYLWRATADCNEAQVTDHHLDPVLGIKYAEVIPATAQGLRTLIEGVTSSLSEKDRARVTAGLRERLNPEGATAQSDAVWTKCAQQSLQERDYSEKLNAYLVSLACVPQPELSRLMLK